MTVSRGSDSRRLTHPSADQPSGDPYRSHKLGVHMTMYSITSKMAVSACLFHTTFENPHIFWNALQLPNSAPTEDKATNTPACFILRDFLEYPIHPWLKISTGAIHADFSQWLRVSALSWPHDCAESYVVLLDFSTEYS